MALGPEDVGRALSSIAAWRADPDAPVPCPVCGETGLTIIDRSARPYAEWYYLTCAECGLEETLHIPMSPPSNALD
jgi:predicted RNA-binding Zn-ribbon protein involved in translation (DUF1610 family)